jgi:hypothetical protein
MVELGTRIARFAAKVRTVTVGLRVLNTSPLGRLGDFSLCLAVAAMNAISASRTACS